MTYSLAVVVHKAEHLHDVEFLGKNDPYVQVTFNYKDDHSFKKTTIKKKAGKHAEWEETLILENYTPNQQHVLYVEVIDDEVGFDAPIGFTDIPLNQIPSIPNQPFRGLFDLYKPDGKQKGTVSLTLITVPAGQHAPNVDVPEVKGRTEIESEHEKHVQSLKSKHKVGNIGTAAAIIGGIAAVKAVHDQRNKPDAKEH
ncbi:hypothetical protein BGX28_003078 [Mortierella sp. GBA30]|nr:hypothetical protein BGX28_003078 [Mortierella sp. GBA30]